MSEGTVQMASKAYQTMNNFINTTGIAKKLSKASEKEKPSSRSKI